MKPGPSYRKLRGGYYTPAAIARFLSDWAIRRSGDVVLEPSCGDGVFLETAAEQLRRLGATPAKLARQLWAHEIDPVEAALAAERLGRFGVIRRVAQVRCNDFFDDHDRDRRFDVVIGNPPFVRYQHFPDPQRDKAFEIMRQAGLHPNRLTNIWVPFVVCASLLLEPDGRLAMVVPAELLQVNYAAELRLFLTRYFHRITVLTFRSLAFAGVQQEVVLLLGERHRAGKGGIEVLELRDAAELARHDPGSFGADGFRSIDQATEKWTQYYLSQGEIDLIRSLRTDARLTRLGDLAETDVGIVTGMNEVFVLADREVLDDHLGRFVRPLVARSAHLPGIRFTEADWTANRGANHKVHLLDLGAAPERSELPAGVENRLRKAEARGLHLGYKCRIRNPWYVVPSIYAPDAFLLRQIHGHPRLVLNETSATCTDTIHRVRFSKRVDKLRVAAAFLNSLTFAFAEVLGRSYGGGVLELEPNEADGLPVPLGRAELLDPRQIDSWVRAGNIAQVLETTDRLLLEDGLGLHAAEVGSLRSVWTRLKTRRTARRNGAG